jgi:hypothetical protein
VVADDKDSDDGENYTLETETDDEEGANIQQVDIAAFLLDFF